MIRCANMLLITLTALWSQSVLKRRLSVTTTDVPGTSQSVLKRRLSVTTTALCHSLFWSDVCPSQQLLYGHSLFGSDVCPSQQLLYGHSLFWSDVCPSQQLLYFKVCSGVNVHNNSSENIQRVDEVEHGTTSPRQRRCSRWLLSAAARQTHAHFARPHLHVNTTNQLTVSQ